MNLQKRYLLMGGAVLAILLTLAAGLLFWGRRPFRGLEAADIAAATVLVAPPDVTLELDAGEIETLGGSAGRCPHHAAGPVLFGVCRTDRPVHGDHG